MNTKTEFIGKSLKIGDIVETTSGSKLIVTDITETGNYLKLDIGGTYYMKRMKGTKSFHMAMDAQGTVKNGIVCSFRS